MMMMERKIKVANVFKKIKEIEPLLTKIKRKEKIFDGRKVRFERVIDERLDNLFNALKNERLSTQELGDRFNLKNRSVLNDIYRLKNKLKSKYEIDRDEECRYYIKVV